MLVESEDKVSELHLTIIEAILKKSKKKNVQLVDENFSGDNIKLYDMKGVEMDPEKYIGDYMDADEFYRCEVKFYNVLYLRICHDITKLVTFTDNIKRVSDLRKYLVFSEVKDFGDDLKEEKDDFKNMFRFTYNHSIINEVVDLHELIRPDHCSRQQIIVYLSVMIDVENEVVVRDRRVLLDLMAQVYEQKDESEINEDDDASF